MNIAASVIGADFFYNTLGEKGIGISIVVMTVIILIFGEVTPKMFALGNSESVSFFASFPLSLFKKIFMPLRMILSGIAHSIIKGFGLKVSEQPDKMTKQEIRALFLFGSKKGIVKEREKAMIENIFEFKKLNAADIMSPRINIVGLDITESREALSKIVKENQFSRFPVYVHTLDNIVGILQAKDFLMNKDAPIRGLVEKPFFVPKSMKVGDLLKELQRKHAHIAIVTDEYGVTSGLVTIEDILEEIVGEIRDEFDFEIPKIRKLDKRTYEVDGQAHIDEVNKKTALNIETSEVDTIGGYVILKMGKIPLAGDKIKIGKFVLTVINVSKNRITSLKIKKK